ncbi:MAG: hypothetical protein AB7P20_03830 [Rhizobiaceae bacterium]
MGRILGTEATSRYPRSMSHVKKGYLVASGEWAKHLRRVLKRAFWKKHRSAEKRLAADRLKAT